jgi:hypothetical protein
MNIWGRRIKPQFDAQRHTVRMAMDKFANELCFDQQLVTTTFDNL